MNGASVNGATFSAGDRPLTGLRVAAVLPCYRVADKVLGVIARIGPECTAIYAVDDCCPDKSGDRIANACTDPRVKVLRHDANQGVGGAVLTGMRAALADGADIIIKIDGDGQMDPALIPLFAAPIAAGRADYVKGNRFFSPEDARGMPKARLLGNLALSFMTKLSSGYWSLFDPNNGYVAIDARVAANLPFDKIAKRYFFESDMLFRLGTLRARVIDLPMRAVYDDENSSLSPMKMVPHFFGRHMVNTFKRITYSYFLRDFSVASIELVVGSLMLLFGLLFGTTTWITNMQAGVVTPIGTVMLAVLPILMGLQFMLAFIGYDIASAPSEPIGPLLGHTVRQPGER